MFKMDFATQSNDPQPSTSSLLQQKAVSLEEQQKENDAAVPRPSESFGSRPKVESA